MDGKRLARERKARGLSMRELARASHVSVQTISNIEKGVFIPRGATLRKLLTALKTAPLLPKL